MNTERLPSVKTIFNNLRIRKEQAERIRSIMERAAPWLDRMQAINTVLAAHGVESIPAGKTMKSPAIAFCNTGETYENTILRIFPFGQSSYFAVGNWGSIVERGNYA